MKLKLIFVFLLAVIYSCSKADDIVIIENEEAEETDPNTNVGVMRDITSVELVADMGVGWNLGNTLDALGADETVWGNPRTTKTMIDAVKAKGFTTIRIPVSWGRHIGGAPNYVIETAWIDRVQEIVDYAVDNDFYIIINSHHEGEWILPTYTKANEVKERLSKLWVQIANRFKNYSDYVIFEVLNEPRLEGSSQEWNGGTSEGRDVVNQYNKVSVDAIRATGGNNSVRHIMIPSYAASVVPIAMNTLIIPNNDERIIVSLHNYFPWSFCGLDVSDPDSTITWGTQADKNQLDNSLNSIYDTFIVNGRAVIMSEWGTKNKDNTAARLTYAQYYVAACFERKLTTVYWDDGGDFILFDRRSLIWRYNEIADAIVDAAK